MHLLKPGGTTAPFWNHPFTGRDDDSIHSEMIGRYAKFVPSSDRFHAGFSATDTRKHTETFERFGFVCVSARLYHRTCARRQRQGLLGC